LIGLKAETAVTVGHDFCSESENGMENANMKTVIIGNGVAGVSVAEAIRKTDSAMDLTIISDEPYHHYSRPRVIEVLSGKTTPDQIVIRKKDWYEKNNIKLLLDTKVVKIDVDTKTIRFMGGGSILYETLVLAGGSYSFVPPFPGRESEGIFTLRTIDDANRIIEYARGKPEALVIGGGLLGIESANSLKSLGLGVTIVEFFDRLLPRQLDNEGALILKEMIEERGISVKVGMHTKAIGREYGGRLSASFEQGESVYSDVILVSAGVKPSLSLIEGTPIVKNMGIKVTNRMATNVPGVYACGDIAEVNGKLYGIWPAAKEQGTVCGRNIAGENVVYEGSVMSTRLKVLDIELGSLGSIDPGPGIETFSRKEKQIYKRIFIKDTKLIGAILLGDTKDYPKLQSLIKSGEDISAIKQSLLGAGDR
jgi:nitrite reductase (NADH) large subunit